MVAVTSDLCGRMMFGIGGAYGSFPESMRSPQLRGWKALEREGWEVSVLLMGIEAEK